MNCIFSFRETLERASTPSPQFPGRQRLSHNRLWDAYLPEWRKGSKNVVDVPEEIKEALKELMNKYRQAAPAAPVTAVRSDDLASQRCRDR